MNVEYSMGVHRMKAEIKNPHFKVTSKGIVLSNMFELDERIDATLVTVNIKLQPASTQLSLA